MDPKARLQYCLNEFAAATGLKLHKNFQLLEVTARRTSACTHHPSYQLMPCNPSPALHPLPSTPATPAPSLHPVHTCNSPFALVAGRVQPGTRAHV